MSFKRLRVGFALAAAAMSAIPGAAGQAPQVYEENIPVDHAEIGYWQTPPRDALTRLANELASGTATLHFDEQGPGYLTSLLDRLGVRADSQTLVYSKTSLQQSAISPRTPRAIYFSDDVTLAYVPDGDAIEMAAVDPRQGVILYRLANRKANAPRLSRPKICLACHQGPATLGVPGVYVGSVLTAPSGRPHAQVPIVSDHRTPFEQRWGGWYVSPADVVDSHRGNSVVARPASDELRSLPVNALAEHEGRYPAAGSDVVALMTLEHQTLMTNLMIRLGWEARVGTPSSRLAARIEEVVRYMLFMDERALSQPVRGASTFSESFAALGPMDSKGRSLRELDLQTRLFRNPLSYMIYSRSFDALPAGVRESVYERLYDVLTDSDPRVDNAPAIVEILRDTKPDLPRSWMESR
jgi:hypothetical protein